MFIYSHLLFSCQLVSGSLRPHGLQHSRLPCPSLSPGVCSDSLLLSQWSHPTISSSVDPFSSCPHHGLFPVSQLLTSGGQSIGASVSVLPVHICSWSPLGLTGLISLLSKGLSRVFSSTTVWKHQFLRAQPSYVKFLRESLLTFTSIHDYWKNHSFDYMDFCQQSDASAF